FREVIQTRKPAVGNLAQDLLIQAPAVPVRVPVVRDGTVVYVLTAAVRPSSLQEVLERTMPPRDNEWAKSFNDRRGLVVARSRDPQRFVGKATAPALIERLPNLAEDFYRMTTLEGVDAYTAASRAPFSRWTATVAFPAASVDGPLHRSLAITLGTG